MVPKTKKQKKKKREIRVFVSSTFRDFKNEREELIKKTFREVTIVEIGTFPYGYDTLTIFLKILPTSHASYFVNPLALRAAKTGLTILLIFSSQKQFYQKYLKEKCLSEYSQQLSFKYFVRICFILKLFSKV